MADTATLAPVSGDATHAAGSEVDKTNLRTRSARSGKNRATAGSGNAENDAKGAKPSGPPRKPKQSRGDSDAPAKPADSATAGEATSEVATGNVKPFKQQREKKPRERKSKAATPSAGESHVISPPPAPASCEPRAATKRESNKSEPRKQEEAATPSDDRKDATSQPPSKTKRGKKKQQQGDDADVDAADLAEAEDAVVVDWSTAAWFSGCDADLGTGYWLLTRAFTCNDTAVLNDEALVRRAVTLQKLHAQLKTELLPHDDGDLEEDGDTAATRKEWTSEEVFNAAVAACPDETRDATNRASTSMTVSLLEGEVVDIATELLISRVGREKLELLTRWEAHLAALLPSAATALKSVKGKADDDTAQVDDSHEVNDDEAVGLEGSDNEEDGTAEAVVADDGDHTTTTDPTTVVLPPPRKRSRRTTGSVTNGIAHAKAQVTAAIAFHRMYANRVKKSAADTVEEAVTTQWTTEIQRIFEATHVSPADEATRQSIAAQIQSAFCRSPHWRHYEVLLFGSSLSKFGSKTSDLDLCLRGADVDLEETKATMSVRELKLRMRRTQQQQNGELPSTSDATSRNDDAPFLQELLTKSHKTVEALANTVKKYRHKTANRRDAKSQRLALLLAHWTALVVALEFFHDKLTIAAGSSRGESETATTHRAAQAAAAAYHTAMRKQQKQRQKDIYAAAALLGRHGCAVDLVVAHARVPVIGFTHSASGFECDLCFDNYHACINTQLLRTYAECDDRARALGLAVKHWAKRRGLNDASIGYLSSYSFILLVIFFLQHKVRLLPNLQHPKLLRTANVAPVKLNGVDVSYCGDVATAKAFHAAQSAETQPSVGSVGDLLLAFFYFYVDEFDFSQHVVSVRHPEVTMRKRERWDVSRLKAWRVSIEDPLELDRDLGSVLQFRCQQRIMEEMARAMQLLRDGQSFEMSVCEAHADVKKNERAKKKDTKKPKTNKRDPPPKKNHSRDLKPKQSGDRTGKKEPVIDGVRHAKDANASPNGNANEDKKANRGQREKPVAKADGSVRKPQHEERPSRERGDKGRRQRPRGGDPSKPKDGDAGAPKPTEA